MGLLDLHPLLLAALAAASLLGCYLFILNWSMGRAPADIRAVAQKPWTREQLRETYQKLQEKPITLDSVAGGLPPRLDRRYIVVGGSGLVGGYIVLQLLKRGQTPESIRIVDFQKPNRRDMLVGLAADVDFIKTDITSDAAVQAAFSRAWPRSVADLPLTVFHTAAVIVPSDRKQLVSGFCEAVNLGGTRKVLAASQRCGADVLVATSSASINVRPVGFWLSPWELLTKGPRGYVQMVDEKDFFEPLREHEGFWGNYPASKARAERVVCGANSEALRTGCIRPANGIYGNPTDNVVGTPLSRSLYPSWTPHVVQSYMHALNCAVAHLQFEAVLARGPGAASLPQAGRPFTVTDPNPPIAFRDLWLAVATLSSSPFRLIPIPPIAMLLTSYAIEWYCLLPARHPSLKKWLPRMPHDAQLLKPALFSITTHIWATNKDAERPVSEGGLGYKGLVNTLDGIVQELLEWNQEHEGVEKQNRRRYMSSVTLADEIRKLGEAAMAVGG